MKNELFNSLTGYVPQLCDEYYYVDSYGDIQTAEWLNSEYDLYRLGQNNCFRLKKEVVEYSKNLKAKSKLKLLAQMLNSKKPIDWNNPDQNKYYITRTSANTLTFYFSTCAFDMGQVYSTDQNFLDEAKNYIGEKRLIAMIKSGV